MATAPTPITAAPDAPDRADRASFSSKGTAWAQYQKDHIVPEVNAAAQNVYANTLEAFQNATAAEAAKTGAQAAQTAAALIAGATEWVSGANYTKGQAVWSPLNYQTYRRRGAGAGTTDPANDPANWEGVGAPGTAVQDPPTVTAPAQFQSAGNLEISFSGASKLVGGSIASFIVVWPDGSSQTVTASGNAGSATKAITGTIGETKTVSVIAVDMLGNASRPTTKTFTIVANNPPTGTLTVSAPTQVNKNSTGNQIAFSGITDADGDGVTYTITDPGILTFSKLKGITAGEIVTFSAGEVAVDTTTVVKVKAVDPKGGETAVVSTSIIVKAVIIVGVVLKTTGGQGGTWSHIDKDGNDIADPGVNWFNSHPVWGGIVDQTIDGQAMVKIPKFYYKRAVISGGANNGKTAWWIASQATTGFDVFPAFKKAGVEIDQFWYGKYQATYDSGPGKLQSIANNANPWVNTTLPLYRSSANNRNTGGVTGFMVHSFWQFAAIQWLYLIEYKTMNSQSKTSSGNVSGGTVYPIDSVTTTAANYRGVTGLWGNVYQFVDGAKYGSSQVQLWDLNGNRTYQAVLTSGSVTSYPITFDASSQASLASFFPATSSASNDSTATIPDSLTLSAPAAGAFRGYAVGGNATAGAAGGLWCVLCDTDDTSAAASVIGTRLAKE